jgi:8-oxo-dGTP diphosphatase
MIDQNIFNERNFHGVKGIIFIRDKMLVYRRDTKTTSFPLCVDLPGGGRENDELPFDTFQRETMEEFGISIDATDVVYAKKYMSIMDPTKESYFIVTRPLDIKESDIIFGDEGLEFMLMSPEEYLQLSHGIKRQQDKVAEYLDTLK